MVETQSPTDPAARIGSRRARLATWIAVGVAIAWLLVGSWAGPLAGSLSQVQENDNAAFLPASAESTLVSDEQAAFADSNSVPILIVISKPDSAMFTASDQGTVGEFIAGIPSLTLSNGESVQTYLDPPPLFPIPSEDGEALLITVNVNGDLGSEQLESGELAFAEITNAIRDYAADFPSVQINVTGPGGFLADLIEVFGAIDGALLIATALVVALILILVYRSPVLWLIPLISAGFALAVASGVVYLLADSDVLVLNGQSQGILTVLVFGAGTDYSL
ncbi:MAG: MMPL family transporter, partial [Candidatus Nanopelagicales bacterium]|nr:MMPL family transporter [Candidatus Nanopelagicales bacterium]